MFTTEPFGCLCWNCDSETRPWPCDKTTDWTVWTVAGIIEQMFSLCRYRLWESVVSCLMCSYSGFQKNHRLKSKCCMPLSSGRPQPHVEEVFVCSVSSGRKHKHCGDDEALFTTVARHTPTLTFCSQWENWPVQVVDYVGVFVFPHHQDLIDDQLLFGLLLQVHLLDGNLGTGHKERMRGEK